MIVIFSFPGDTITNKIIDWLKFYNINFQRIHLENEDFRNIEIHFKKKINLFLNLKNGERLDISKVDFFIVRGVGFNFDIKISKSTVLPESLYKHYINKEFNSLVNFFYKEVNKKSIGCFYTGQDFDKLTQLKIAQELKLDIPKTLITSEKNKILKSLRGNLITKAIYDNVAIEDENNLYVQRVQKLNVEKLETSFFPSLVQEEIIKDYEVRSFYLNGFFYSISICSNKGEVDLRDNYNISKYNRYELPGLLKLKLDRLMKKLNLVSGSIDLIKSNGKYFFLEVNPTGQYDWVSVFGYHDLHHKIVKFLISKIRI